MCEECHRFGKNSNFVSVSVYHRGASQLTAKNFQIRALTFTGPQDPQNLNTALLTKFTPAHTLLLAALLPRCASSVSFLIYFEEILYRYVRRSYEISMVRLQIDCIHAQACSYNSKIISENYNILHSRTPNMIVEVESSTKFA